MSGSKKSTTRKSPEKSATLYKIGTKKTGLDGNMWIVTENKNGIKRWVLFKVKKANSKTPRKKPVEKKTVKPRTDKSPTQTIIYNKSTKKLERYYRGKWYNITGKNIYDFKASDEEYDKYVLPQSVNLHNISKLLKSDDKIKKIGSIEITGNTVGIGELLYDEMPIAKGSYDIMDYNGSLIILKQGKDITKQKFKLINDMLVGCDIGMFSFNDARRLRPYLKKTKGDKLFGISFPDISTEIFVNKNRRVKPTTDAYYVYESDIVKGADNKKPIALFAGNKYGDGGFAVYKSLHGYFILNPTVDKILFIYSMIKKQIKGL